ncbi:acyl-CoA N-acyltransferase [Conidiobolus coronatus NRRL 28638]|uniref:Glucosamine 6-phosphate N-acetyltransferase n=1 Tax=Conidiobolus coronatus (strain ATCC 28846 / CBS 209.66 / NRRL 28638) TaxID=796925 RepID=A0A137P244_CONC2|nr:acyl-CoA N-acyltransferase [Conidiobolus coronatus NRRL 28638]|eukprot:KXN69092.1 acyl-CoA N-acyltransferase [Conidiobolus coronatus NRRL 28638]
MSLNNTDIHVGLASTEKLKELAFALRIEVFVNEVGLLMEDEFDGIDPEAHHIIATVGPIEIATSAIGTCRLFKFEDNVGGIGRVAVSSSQRGHNIGQLVVSHAQKHAKSIGMSAICLEALEQAQNFYRRLGYKSIGDTYIKESVPHLKMLLEL